MHGREPYLCSNTGITYRHIKLDSKYEDARNKSSSPCYPVVNGDIARPVQTAQQRTEHKLRAQVNVDP